MCTIRELLTEKGKEIYTISPNATVFEAASLMAEKDIGALIVIDEEKKIVGLFSERDYTRNVACKGRSSREATVQDLMARQVYFIDPERTIKDCLRLMTFRKTRHVPVVENNNLLGIVSIGDIANKIISEQDTAIEDLEGILYGGYVTVH